MKNLRFVGWLAGIVGVQLGSAAPARAQIAIERVDVDGSGHEVKEGGVPTAVSRDGRYVVFYSFSDDLVPGDTNGTVDVFLKERATGGIVRISVSTDDEEGNDQSAYGTISADGNLVAFASNASNFVAGDSNDRTDVFVRDRVAFTTECVSVTSSGVPGDAGSGDPAMTPDGLFVVFSSGADDLVSHDDNGFGDVFLRDRRTGWTSLVSVKNGTSSGGDGESSLPSISDDGLYVAFTSQADDLVGGDTNGVSDVFVRDRHLGTTERVSVDRSGAQADGECYGAVISSNGRWVAFSSYADNLVDGDTNGDSDVFVHDRVTGKTERVSVDSSGRQIGADSFLGAMSASGQVVAFSSASADLVEDDTNGMVDVFLRDRRLGVTERVSLDADGGQGDALSMPTALSRDGHVVAFESFSTNLVAGDTNGTVDAFVVERCEIDSTWSNYGDGLPGTYGVPTLVSRNDPVLGTTATVDLANSYGQWTFALLFAGTERADFHSSLGGDLLLLPTLTLVVGLPPWGASYATDLPTNGIWCGMTLDVQAIESDPGAVKGASFTEGLELLLGH
jgi:Tol biopolymer transport system component